MIFFPGSQEGDRKSYRCRKQFYCLRHELLLIKKLDFIYKKNVLKYTDIYGYLCAGRGEQVHFVYMTAFFKQRLSIHRNITT